MDLRGEQQAAAVRREGAEEEALARIVGGFNGVDERHSAAAAVGADVRIAVDGDAALGIEHDPVGGDVDGRGGGVAKVGGPQRGTVGGGKLGHEGLVAVRCGLRAGGLVGAGRGGVVAVIGIAGGVRVVRAVHGYGQHLVLRGDVVRRGGPAHVGGPHQRRGAGLGGVKRAEEAIACLAVGVGAAAQRTGGVKRSRRSGKAGRSGPSPQEDKAIAAGGKGRRVGTCGVVGALRAQQGGVEQRVPVGAKLAQGRCVGVAAEGHIGLIG